MLKRSQVVILLLVALMSIAVYLNMSYNKKNGDFAITQAVETGKVLGEAKSVANEEEEPAAETALIYDYFSQARLLRSKTRDETLTLLRSVAENKEADQSTRQKALDDMATIASAVECEGRIENLVKAKGFADCVAYLSNTGINVVVKSDGLNQVDTAKIKEIILSEITLSGDKIKIIASK
jgi:stage III sporulation protein AH